MGENFFFRIYELRKNFRFLTTDCGKNKIAKYLPSCVTEKLNGFSFVRSDIENKTRVLYAHVGIIFDSVKRKLIKIKFFT